MAGWLDYHSQSSVTGWTSVRTPTRATLARVQVEGEEVVVVALVEEVEEAAEQQPHHLEPAGAAQELPPEQEDA